MKRAVLAAIAGALVLQLHQGAPMSAQAPDALKFFKNYFITGDYAVGGVGLKGQGVGGIATGSIAIAGVPENADVVGAFLYWQVVANEADGPDAGSIPVTFKGHPLSSADGPFGKMLGAATSPCSRFIDGLNTGINSVYSYRADALRFFDIDETTGKFIVNGLHEVQLPDGGGKAAVGASLVVLYRDSTLPLSAIVIYDGSYTMDQASPFMSQAIQGFYQPATTAARLTHIAGGGMPYLSQRLLFNGSPIAGNPFNGSLGGSWDNPTFDVTSPTAQSLVTTSVDHGEDGDRSFDCLTWSAVVYKTAVQDTDGDGLLDNWELNGTGAIAPLTDPGGEPLPLLGQMGADPNRKDLFIETAYMHTDADTAYGGVVKPAHSHQLTHEALKLVGDAFKNAPEPVAVHFDMGAAYPGPGADGISAEEYIIRGAHARGGESVHELTTVCERGELDPPWVCQFSGYPGTVGWKTGFRFIRDEVLSVTPPPGEVAPPPGEEFCGEPGYTCNRRFDSNRMDMFRYALLAHGIGLPKSEDPESPDFHVPRTNTGIGDFPGGDVMVTLGGFPDASDRPVGTPFMQASTLMHELGHNAERRHGGDAFEPNCKPTYLSVMNYLYQLRGLLDDAGRPHLDFSRQIHAPVNETLLSDGPLGFLPYRIGWYAPLAGSYLEDFGRPATKHCDGTDLLETDVPMVRIDSIAAAAGIDWNANGAADANVPLDVNFNGRTAKTDGSPEILAGSNDWGSIILNQTGGRRNTGALYVVDSTGLLALGPLSLDSGRGDLGRGDLGRGDLGRGDLGRGDLGRGDLGRGDLGRGDLGRGDLGNPALGRGDLGRGDLGGGDLFVNNPDLPGGELDFETATELAKTPPNEFSACIIGVTCPGPPTPLHAVRMDWKVPNVGGVTSYILYRVPGPTLDPDDVWTTVGEAVTVPGQIDYSFIDESPLVGGATYTYFVVSIYADGTRSDPSNFVTVVAVNDAPVMSAIADQVIAANTSTGPLAFTIADEDLASVTVSGSSSNSTLVPNAAIVFGGSGANRTVTVTPALNQSGTATITVTVTDGGGGIATDSFDLAVTPLGPRYLFLGFGPPLTLAGTDAAPRDAGKFQWGSTIPVKWILLASNVPVIDLGAIALLEAVPGDAATGTCEPNGDSSLVLLDPSASTATFGIKAKLFQVDWDTSNANIANCYRLRLTLTDGSGARVVIVRFKETEGAARAKRVRGGQLKAAPKAKSPGAGRGGR